jgi:hypothetical protein
MNRLLSVQVKPRSWLVRAVVLAGMIGVIHVLLTPVFFQQWLGYGVFFFTAAALQVFYSMVLAVNPPNRLLLWAGIAGNALTIALWAITRTVGIPLLGPMAGEVLPVGVPDAASKFFELAQIAHLAVLLRFFDQLGDRPLIE